MLADSSRVVCSSIVGDGGFKWPQHGRICENFKFIKIHLGAIMRVNFSI